MYLLYLAVRFEEGGPYVSKIIELKGIFLCVVLSHDSHDGSTSSKRYTKKSNYSKTRLSDKICHFKSRTTCLPGKTGWTENARENLVTYMERDGHKIMIAILGSQDRFGETRELIEWIFNNYSWEEVKPNNNGNK